MEFKPEFLHATVTLSIPAVEADPAVWDSYSTQTMADNYAEQLKNNLIEMIEAPFDDETLGIDVKVEIKKTED